ncbi:hypothetical protein ISCGN_019503 [Ixodes scapularis]
MSHASQLPDGGATPTPAKRHLSESSSGEFAHTTSMLQDDEGAMDGSVLGSKEDCDFTTVNRKKKRTRHEGSQRSQGIVKLPNTARTVLFAPTVPATNLRKINRQLLSDELEALAPGQFSGVRVNTRKNIIATDARTEAGVLELLILTKICGVPVRAFLPRSKNSRVGVISDVDTDITEDRLSKIIGSGVSVVQVRRLGKTQAVKVVFEGDTLPAHVKIGLVRHSVRPFVQRPLQCRQCFRIGHVVATCPNSAICPKCAQAHGEENCTSAQKCVNCQRAHEATSTECPKLQKEKETCKVKVRENITFLEAAKVVEEQRKIKRRNNQHVEKPGAGTSQPKSQTAAQGVDPGAQGSSNPAGAAKADNLHNGGRDNHARGLTYRDVTQGSPPNPAADRKKPRYHPETQGILSKQGTSIPESAERSTASKFISLVFNTVRRLLELLPPSEFRTTLNSLLFLEGLLGAVF